MRKRAMKRELEQEIVLADRVYDQHPIRFDQLLDVDGCIRLHLLDQLPETADRYMLYDRGIEGGLWLEGVEQQEEGLQFDYEKTVMGAYVGKPGRYTLLAVDEAHKRACPFYYAGTLMADAYVHLDTMLHQAVSGAWGDGHPVGMVFYSAGEEQLLRLIVQDEALMLKPFLEARVKRVRLKRDHLRLDIVLKDVGYRITRVYMKLRSKTEDMEHDFHIETEKRNGSYHVKADVHLEGLQMAQFYWDIKAEAEKDGIVREIDLKNRENWMHRLMYLKLMSYSYRDGNIVYPYKTQSRNIALQFRPKTAQDCASFMAKEYLALIIFYALRPWLKRKNIWLVYEKYCVMAQDNSYYFFKYCMEQLPESERRRIYYVIDKKAPDYQYVKQYGDRVIDFLSLKHMVYLKAASLLISSDTKAHAYAWHSPNTIYRMMLRWKENVFLQHGVIAFKCCHQGLRKKSVNGSNLFVVSSETERRIIREYFGYEKKEILVTGLARWDVLRDKSEGQPRQIILMPTWRTWLEEVSEEVFKASDYYQHYMALLNNQTLIDTLKQYRVTLNFYIHPKFREYMGAFSVDSDYVRLIPFGSEPLNEMMMRCSMMITDYSSAVWDVFYQGKPVLFYLFDLELYNEVQGSYINMETEAFGDVAHRPDELAALIREYAEQGFREKECYRAMRGELIAYIDDQNSARIYGEIAKRYPTSLRNS